MKKATVKIGTLAKRTGLTIRTLRYYDEIGLLPPTARSETGYRLYSHADIVRLQQIQSLRQMGFSLKAIQACLDDPDFSPLRIVQRQMVRVQIQQEGLQKLYHRLEALAQHLQTADSVSAELFLQTIEMMTMHEKYFTAAQRAELAARAEAMGPEKMQEAQGAWQTLIAAVRAAMDAGQAPDHPAVQALAARWQALVTAFTGGNPEIAQSLRKMYQQEGPAQASRQMVDPALHEYMGKALAALQAKTN